MWAFGLGQGCQFCMCTYLFSLKENLPEKCSRLTTAYSPLSPQYPHCPSCLARDWVWPCCLVGASTGPVRPGHQLLPTLSLKHLPLLSAALVPTSPPSAAADEPSPAGLHPLLPDQLLTLSGLQLPMTLAGMHLGRHKAAPVERPASAGTQWGQYSCLPSSSFFLSRWAASFCFPPMGLH